MEQKTNERKLYNILIWCCFIFYNTTLISKNVFTAQIVNITKYLGIEKTTAQLCSTYYFFPYAIGQLLLIPFVKKINLNKALLITSIFSSIIVASMAFANNIVFFYVTHAFNGALQILTWVGVISICSKYLPGDLLPKANKFLSFGFASGNCIAYLTSALFSAINLWKGTFIFSGLIMLVAIIIMYIVVKKVDGICKNRGTFQESENKTKREDSSYCVYSINGRTFLFYFIVVIASLAVYSVYYAIMPNVTFFFSEVYNMDPSLSILITVFFPIVVSFGGILSVSICEKCKRYLLVTTTCSLITGMLLIILAFMFNVNFIFALFLLLLILSINRCGTTVIGVVFVVDLRKEIDTGKFSAITNAFGSISASIMPPLLASFIPNADPNWKKFFIVCVFLALATSLIALLFDTLFKKKKRQSN